MAERIKGGSVMIFEVPIWFLIVMEAEILALASFVWHYATRKV